MMLVKQLLDRMASTRSHGHGLKSSLSWGPLIGEDDRVIEITMYLYLDGASEWMRSFGQLVVAIAQSGKGKTRVFPSIHLRETSQFGFEFVCSGHEAGTDSQPLSALDASQAPILLMPDLRLGFNFSRFLLGRGADMGLFARITGGHQALLEFGQRIVQVSHHGPPEPGLSFYGIDARMKTETGDRMLDVRVRQTG